MKKLLILIAILIVISGCGQSSNPIATETDAVAIIGQTSDYHHVQFEVTGTYAWASVSTEVRMETHNYDGVHIEHNHTIIPYYEQTTGQSGADAILYVYFQGGAPGDTIRGQIRIPDMGTWHARRIYPDVSPIYLRVRLN